jgi:hypothetical protein
MSLQEIIDALEKADGPKRALDCHLWVLSKGGDARMHYVDGDTKTFVWERGLDGMWIRNIESVQGVPKFTGSVDAAIALCERVLPEYGWDVASNTEHIKACLAPEFGEPIGKHPHWAAVSKTRSKQFEDGATPAIAICLATLRAKLEEPTA